MFQTLPARTAAPIRWSVAAIASTSPMPWRMVFAISSPGVGSGSRVVSRFIALRFYTIRGKPRIWFSLLTVHFAGLLFSGQDLGRERPFNRSVAALQIDFAADRVARN